MLFYYTHLSMNSSFNKDILINMFINWMNNSKNKMNSLEYQGQNDFEYQENNKIIKIHDFKD